MSDFDKILINPEPQGQVNNDQAYNFLTQWKVGEIPAWDYRVMHNQVLRAVVYDGTTFLYALAKDEVGSFMEWVATVWARGTETRDEEETSEDFFQRVGIRIETPQINYIVKKTVLSRGWTAATIKKWLGAADKFVRNPHYSSSAPMNLFNEARVVAAEQRPDFLEWKIKNSVSRANRSARMKKVRANERKLLFDKIAVTEIPIPKMSFNYLKNQADNHFLLLSDQRGWSSQSAFCSTEKKCVNFLRHECSPYESMLNNLYGKTGKSEAYIFIKTKVLEAISQKYEFLKDECDMQIAKARS